MGLDDGRRKRHGPMPNGLRVWIADPNKAEVAAPVLFERLLGAVMVDVIATMRPILPRRAQPAGLTYIEFDIYWIGTIRRLERAAQ